MNRGSKHGIILLDKTYGKLTVIQEIKYPVYLFSCDCGNTVRLKYTSVLSGNTKSCGCLKKEGGKHLYKHGYRHNKEYAQSYRAWLAMRDRCNNPNNISFAYYGGRGIAVCDRWSDYTLFLEDMGLPKPKETLDRINSDLGYNPLNCRWVTRLEQSRNRAYCKKYNINGVEKFASDWATEFNIKPRSFYLRYKLHNQNPQRYDIHYLTKVVI